MDPKTFDPAITFYAARNGEIGTFTDGEILSKERLDEVREHPDKYEALSPGDAALEYSAFLEESMTAWLKESENHFTFETFVIINSETGKVSEYTAELELKFSICSVYPP